MRLRRHLAGDGTSTHPTFEPMAFARIVVLTDGVSLHHTVEAMELFTITLLTDGFYFIPSQM